MLESARQRGKFFGFAGTEEGDDGRAPQRKHVASAAAIGDSDMKSLGKCHGQHRIGRYSTACLFILREGEKSIRNLFEMLFPPFLSA